MKILENLFNIRMKTLFYFSGIIYVLIRYTVVLYNGLSGKATVINKNFQKNKNNSSNQDFQFDMGMLIFVFL